VLLWELNVLKNVLSTKNSLLGVQSKSQLESIQARKNSLEKYEKTERSFFLRDCLSFPARRR